MGTLYIVATPIGNLEDITIRAIKTLFAVSYIACEDTRVTGQLLHLLRDKMDNHGLSVKGVDTTKKPQLISYYDEVEKQKAPEIIHLLEQGHDVALVSDAGTPLLSDPGFRLVNHAIKQSIKVVPIPGASSVLAALVTSGLPTHDMRFLGYLPPKRGKRVEKLKSMISDQRPHGQYNTIILFEAPQRIRETLDDIQSVFGNIDIVIARELTKVYEEFIRGNVSDLLNRKFEEKGEFVLLFKI